MNKNDCTTMYIKIDEIVINSGLLVRTKLCTCPKVSCFEIACFSYTKRYNESNTPLLANYFYWLVTKQNSRKYAFGL